MSSPPQGRPLTFPTVWGRDRGLSPTAAETEDPKPSDEQLMALVRENNSEALEGLFNRYSRLVLCIARRIVHDAGEAEEVAALIVFLASDRAGWMTGETIPIDGGRHLTCAR